MIKYAISIKLAESEVSRTLPTLFVFLIDFKPQSDSCYSESSIEINL